MPQHCKCRGVAWVQRVATYVAPTKWRAERGEGSGLRVRTWNPSSSRPAALLVFLAAATRARCVAVGGGFPADRLARGQGVDAVVVQVGQHVGKAGDDLQSLAVADRGGGGGRVVGQHFAAGEAVEQAEHFVDPFVVVEPLVPRGLAQADGGEEAQRPVAADVEFVFLL